MPRKNPKARQKPSKLIIHNSSIPCVLVQWGQRVLKALQDCIQRGQYISLPKRKPHHRT